MSSVQAVVSEFPNSKILNHHDRISRQQNLFLEYRQWINVMK